MSCMDKDLEFHGTKKRQPRKTARLAYMGKTFLIQRKDVKAFIQVLRNELEQPYHTVDDRTTLNLRALVSIYDRYGKGKDLTLSFK